MLLVLLKLVPKTFPLEYQDGKHQLKQHPNVVKKKKLTVEDPNGANE
jgi:hypothetical protein